MGARDIRRFAMLVVIGAAVACGDSPGSPTPSLTGTWRGTMTREGVNGTIALEMAQRGAGVSGTWSAAIEGEAALAGTFGGTVAGSAIMLALTPSAPIACSPNAALSGTRSMTGTVSGAHVTGEYVVFLCDGAATGRIDLVRQ